MNGMALADIAVFGGGAFGTALAIAFARDGQHVALWTRDAGAARAMAETRENATRLPGAYLPSGVKPTGDAADAAKAPVVLLAVPTQTLREVLSEHAAVLAGRRLVLCCKGVELGTGLLPTQVAEAVLPGTPVAVLTGPSFAADIARDKPTALTLACADDGAEALQAALACQNLRLYRTDDLVGAQLGGALKNVIAIAAGVAIGAGLGESARAALMTRGFAEIVRLAQTRGALPETLMGLSGFGDLVLTCTSDKSRNYGYGVAIGAGEIPDRTKTVEGAATARAIAQSAAPDAMPVICMVADLLAGKVSLNEARELLLSRPLRHERG